MNRQPFSKIDFSALVDIISNVAGMMILLACVAIVINQNADVTDEIKVNTYKSISFPLAYVPDKRSVTLCLKYKRLYTLPEKELLEEISKLTARGDTTESLILNKNGVNAVIELTPTLTGYRFRYKLDQHGGSDLRIPRSTVTLLKDLLKDFPPHRFFYVLHTWPDSFPEFRKIREYLMENGAEVGWVPRTYDPHSFDVMYSIGEYDENLTTIKAQ